jgi:hypothetical protein
MVHIVFLQYHLLIETKKKYTFDMVAHKLALELKVAVVDHEVDVLYP